MDEDRGINGNQMEGDEYCEFIYNDAKLDCENCVKLNEKRMKLGDSCIRDWEYQSMHLFILSVVLSKRNLKMDGILDKTIKDFTMLYGGKYR